MCQKRKALNIKIVKKRLKNDRNVKSIEIVHTYMYMFIYLFFVNSYFSC